MAEATLSDVGKDVAGNPAIDGPGVEPDGIGVADVADDIAAKHHVVRAVELSPGRLPLAFRVGPPAPLDEVILDEHICCADAGDAFDTAITDRIAADDVALRSALRGTPPPPISKPIAFAHSMVLSSMIQWLPPIVSSIAPRCGKGKPLPACWMMSPFTRM